MTKIQLTCFAFYCNYAIFFKFTNYFNKPLVLKDWEIKSQSSFSKGHSKIDWLIDLVTNIRSTKVNLNVSPGSFIEVSTAELSSNKISIS